MKNEDMERHLSVTFPALERRVEKLEDSALSYVKIQVKVEEMDKTLGGLQGTVTSFCKEMREAYSDFVDKARSNNTSFIRWLIGSILISLMCGLFFQYRSFHEVHESIYSIREEMNRAIYDVEKKVIINQKASE